MTVAGDIECWFGLCVSVSVGGVGVCVGLF
jgi:hypothetical protein